MNLYQLKKIKQLLVVVIGLMVILLIRLFTLSNTYLEPSNRKEIIIKTDTVWTTLADTFYLNTKQYETVYLTKIDTVYRRNQWSNDAVKLYKDTLETKAVTIYSQQFITGDLIKGQLSYRLHIPEIVNTVNIKEKSTLLRSALFTYGEIGGHSTGFTNISLGLLYTHQTKWIMNYRFQLNPIYKPTHHIGVGYRIF